MDIYIYKGEKFFSTGLLDFRIFQKEINRYMYIPAKSGHVSHTIKNYVLGELKRYIRYNSLKLTFLKIRTKFFSRLRNRGFKKVWLRKHFATLKYEDREKLMAIKDSDSSSSHPEFQMVLEREAGCLKTLRSRLADKFPYQTDSNRDIDGNKTLFPMEPNRGLGGTISGLCYNLQELQCKPCNIEIPEILTQEKVRESTKAAAATITAATALQKVPLPEEARMSDGTIKRWNDPEKPSDMYLVLPSYTEPHSKAINKLIAEEKEKLCSNSLFKQLFANIDFKIAFSNSKNIKKLIVRTKV